ncbi:hypothetical protein [Saccharothrix deserti]|uniref:hypothetical protein n=1 Tax=Saccharothrix deserti TaxID=2593674 RepID=UPI00131E5F0C|nr:hypothetical protein [Saccharothrix deserti]
MSTHPVANGRRWIAGIGALLIAAAVGVLLAWLITNPGPGRSYGGALALVMIVIVAALPVVGTQLGKAVRGGFAESFELYDNGIAHIAHGRRRGWTWEQVEAVAAAEKGERLGLGWDFGCAVLFHDGKRLQFNSLTRDARTIAAALVRHCPQAVGRSTTSEWVEELPFRLAPPLLIGFGGALWWAVSYTVDHNDELTGAAVGGFAALMIFCVAGIAVSAIFTVLLIMDRFF